MDLSTIPEGTVICLLCRGAVTYLDNDKDMFFKHLKMQHSVHYDHQFLLAVNFFDEDSKKMVIQNFEETTERTRKETLINEINNTFDDNDEVDDHDKVKDHYEDMEELEFMAKVDNQINKITSLNKKESAVESMIDVDEFSLDESIDESEMDSSIETVPLEVNKLHDKKFKCGTCGEYFQLFTLLKQHKLTHHSGNTKSSKTCHICSAVMSNSGNLKRHMVRRHPDVDTTETKNNPNVSGDEMSARTELMVEQKNDQSKDIKNDGQSKDVRNDNLSTVCFQCKVDLLTFKRLTRHKSNTKHQIYPPQDKSDLQVKIEILDEAPKMKGTLDSNEFSNFGQHFLTTNNQTPTEVIECKLCSKHFMTKKLLSRHNSKHHTVKPFSCEDCPKSFVDWLNLRRHMFQYHPNSLKKPAFGKDKKEEVNKDNTNDTKSASAFPENDQDLNELINDVKRELKNVNGDLGENAMEDISPSILATHITNDSKEDSLTCNICNKKCDTPHKLKRHKITHTGIKPFSCDKCDTTFSQRANLKRHINTFHK